ncbi:hypothetical protein [Polyangium jinanense]|uniref:Uncharacterized protein n=1 Tax=Polyangium jinanense TaxID=2829994 RepID=A0A9X4ATP3_9BACT|nr:hypothetical protein [Polyangium jinanense]MDC3982417.1 hypothetical protein [Polyangium jinanense]
MNDAARDFALSAEERRALHALIEKFGERVLVAELNVSRQALGRALAGLGVRRGTIALVRAGLASPNIQAKLKGTDDARPSRRST